MAEPNTIPIAELFTRQRGPVSSVQFGLLCVYFPFGVILAVFRLLFGFNVFIASCLLAKGSTIRTRVLRVLCTILGLVIVESGSVSPDSTVIVSNHVSPLDHTAVELATPCVLPSVWDLPPLLMWFFGYADLGARRGRQILIDSAKKFCGESRFPLLAFPEGAMTNGARGLLRFDSWPFALGLSVQPFVISIDRPTFAQLAPTIVGSRWWTDILWFMFVPYSVFRIRWLSQMSRGAGESVESFAKRVQSKVASESGVAETEHTSHDAVEYAKRLLLEEERLRRHEQRIRHAQRNNDKSSFELDSMALKVKEMFPQVPLHVIRKDVERTTSVELTSANIVEGRLEFEPQTTETTKSTNLNAKADPGCWKSIYDERKWGMIEENRKKYCIRKGIRH